MSKAQRQRRKSAKDSQEESQDSGMRVYELAKEYNLTNKELIALLEEHGVRVKNGMSSLDPDTVALIESELADEPVDKTEDASEEGVENTSESEAIDTNGGLQVEEGTTVK